MIRHCHVKTTFYCNQFYTSDDTVIHVVITDNDASIRVVIKDNFLQEDFGNDYRLCVLEVIR